jgi:uncharacterized protein YjbI with pentapeptide repeats
VSLRPRPLSDEAAGSVHVRPTPGPVLEPPPLHRLWTVRIRIRDHWVAVSWLPLVGVGLAVTVLVVLAYRRQWRWTGFAEKTLWDWLQLLVIPIALAALAFLLNNAQSDREQRRENAQSDREQRREDARAARQRAMTTDATREEALRGYLAQMSGLMLDRELLQTKRRSNVRAVARTITLTTLRRLDGERKGLVVQFLREARLIESWDPKVSLEHADLRFADLPLTDLVGVNLVFADLRRANLHEAFLRDARLAYADLRAADLRKALLIGADFETANLDGAELGGALLRGADLGLTHLENANLREAYLREAYLSGAFLSEADLRAADLREANLYGASLLKADLSRADLRNANLGITLLGEADLRSANLRNTNLRGAKLHDADLRGADLRNANLRDATLPDADLRGADLRNTNLRDANRDGLDGAQYNSRTRWPSGFAPGEAGATEAP